MNVQMALMGKGKKTQVIIAQGSEENWEIRYSGKKANIPVHLLYKVVSESWTINNHLAVKGVMLWIEVLKAEYPAVEDLMADADYCAEQAMQEGY